MKKISLLIAVLVIAAPLTAGAQVQPLRERVVSTTTTATTTPAQPAPTPATSTPVTPAPTTPVVPSTAEPTPPAEPPPASPISETPLSETPVSQTGASADPNVLAAQNSDPTAASGSVYRGNTLPLETTFFLLILALICGVAGAVLTAAPPAPLLAPRSMRYSA